MNVTNEGEIKEIRALARKRGIEGYKRMWKTELRDVLAQPQRLLFVLSRLIQTFLFLNYGEAMLLKAVMERSTLGLSAPLFYLSQDLPFTSFTKLLIDLENYILKNRNRRWIMHVPYLLHIRFSKIKRFGNNAHGLAESRAFHYFVKSVYTNQQYLCVCFANKSTYYPKCLAT